MKGVVQLFRSAFPKAAILVVSVPDREQRTASGIATMKEVRQLVACQQQLAANCHVSFYNFFQAMGGSGTMAALVDRNMANKDYTHLSHGGGRLVAQKVFPSFVAGFNNYMNRKKIESK